MLIILFAVDIAKKIGIIPLCASKGKNIFLARQFSARPRLLARRGHGFHTRPEAGFYSDVVECLPLDPAAQVRFPPRAVGIFLHPVTFGGQQVGSTACVSGITQQEMSRNYRVVPIRFGDEST